MRAAPVRPSAAVCRAIEIIEAESAYSQHVCAPAHEAARLGLAAERMGSAAVILTRNSKNTMYNKLAALGQASPATWKSESVRVRRPKTAVRSPPG